MSSEAEWETRLLRALFVQDSTRAKRLLSPLDVFPNSEKTHCPRSVRFAHIQYAIELKLGPPWLKKMSNLCYASDYLSCVAYAALNDALPVLEVLLPRLNDKDKKELSSLLSVLLIEKKLGIVELLLIQGIGPSPEDNTFWMSLMEICAESGTTDCFTLALGPKDSNGKKKASDAPISFSGQKYIKTWCRTRLDEGRLSPKAKVVVEAILDQLEAMA